MSPPALSGLTVMLKASRTSQTQLASLAGVSRSTVSRALAGHPGISEEVASRIRSLAQKMDYRPNAAARSFVTQSHNTIGLVLCDRSVAVPGYAEIAAAVEARARADGLKLQLSLCDSSQLGENQLPPIFQDDGIDGVVLTGNAPDWLLQRLSRWRMPFVLLGSQAGRTGVNQVTGDPEQGGRLMTRHLLQQGHRRIRLLVGPRAKPIHQHYFNGFKSACLDVGLGEREIEAAVEEVATPDPAEAVQRLLRELATDAPVTAVFSDTSLIAWQVVQHLRAWGVRVPEQVSVAGAGRAWEALNLPIDLTTIDVQVDEMSRVAVQLLREVIRTPDAAARRIVIEPRLTVGSTTAPPHTAAAASARSRSDSPFSSSSARVISDAMEE